jgi:phenylpropionate dioxygenase-like ring-hydroxylating dioxygenase large terminal subunit
MEREVLFTPAWTVVGHESQLPRRGDFITADIGVERVLLVRDGSGVVHAVRNSCPELPHALIAVRQGHFDEGIQCTVHGLRFSLDGRAHGGTTANLKALEFDCAGGLLWVKPSRAERPGAGRATLDVPLDIEPAPGLMMLGPPRDVSIEADWKVLVEQWLESAPLDGTPGAASVSLAWDAPLLNSTGWSAGRYVALVACLPEHPWRRQFIAPHQLLESRPDGLSVLQAMPAAPGRSLLRRLEFTALPPDDSARASLYLARRLARFTRRSMRDMAESVQRGIVDFGYELPYETPVAPAVAWFRALLASRLPVLLSERPPNDAQTSL